MSTKTPDLDSGSGFDGEVIAAWLVAAIGTLLFSSGVAIGGVYVRLGEPYSLVHFPTWLLSSIAVIYLILAIGGIYEAGQIASEKLDY